MLRLTLGSLLIGITAPAQAAVDWCALAAQVPTYSYGFEQIDAAVDQLGCAKAAIQSAHSRKWTCRDEQSREVIVQLERVTEGSAAGSTLYAIGADEFVTLDKFRGCPFTHTTASFDPKSIAVRDRLAVRKNYLPVNLTLLNLTGAFGIAISTSPDTDSALGFVEQALFGFKRPLYPTSSVEIAGKNLLQTSATSLVAALVERGSKVLTDDHDYPVRKMTLSPPVGLEGVISIEVETTGQLTGSVKYRIQGEANYQPYVELLDSKYGRSSPKAVQRAGKVGCRGRWWTSGSVELYGEYCPSGEASISFYNTVANDEAVAFTDFLDRQPSKVVKKIDPDNL